MGSGIAARVASWNRPKLLILDSPYLSFFHQVKRFGFFLPLKWLLKYQLRTDLFIRKVEAPIFIVHGRKDRLIPFQHSERLKAIAPEQVRLFPIADGGHNNLPAFADYHEWLYDVLNDEQLLKEWNRGFSAAA